MPDPSESLLADVRTGPPSALSRWGRRSGLIVLLVVVLIGALGGFGVHRRTVSATGNGYSLAVTYPQIARAGLDVPLRITVSHAGGVDTDVMLAITSSYFDMFEAQGTYPDPSDDTNDGQFVYFQYSQPPPGQNFVLDFDLYIQPGSQIGKKAVVKLLIGGREVTQTSLRTWLVP